MPTYWTRCVPTQQTRYVPTCGTIGVPMRWTRSVPRQQTRSVPSCKTKGVPSTRTISVPTIPKQVAQVSVRQVSCARWLGMPPPHPPPHPQNRPGGGARGSPSPNRASPVVGACPFYKGLPACSNRASLRPCENGLLLRRGRAICGPKGSLWEPGCAPPAGTGKRAPSSPKRTPRRCNAPGAPSWPRRSPRAARSGSRPAARQAATAHCGHGKSQAI